MVSYRDDDDEVDQKQPITKKSSSTTATPDFFDDEPDSEHNNGGGVGSEVPEQARSTERRSKKKPSSASKSVPKSSSRNNNKGKKNKKNSRNANNARSRSSSRDDGNHIDDGTGEEQQQRPHRYSTADQKESGRCKKFLLILLVLLVMILIMIGISKLMEHFFYGDKSDNKDMSEFVRNPNSTFPLDKTDIEAVCSRGSMEIDEGAACRNACEPVYYTCCDPFNEWVLYDTYSTEAPSFLGNDSAVIEDDDRYPGGLDASDFAGRLNGTNATIPPTASDSITPPGIEYIPYDDGSNNETDTDTGEGDAPIDANSTAVNNNDDEGNQNGTITDATNSTLEPDNTESTMSPSNNGDNREFRSRRLMVRRVAAYELMEREVEEQRQRELQQDPLFKVEKTVAPVWWADHKQKMDEAIAAKGNRTCAFDNELSGCMRYAKCQALTKKIDPAPAALIDFCNATSIEKDPVSCQSLCADAACCWATDSSNCLAKDFDLCLDYAPCQNLRMLDTQVSAKSILPTSSRLLDFNCFYEQMGCLDECKIAECCSNSNSLCFRNNFIPCLTYSPCNNITKTHIHVPPQFGYLDKPPDAILTACDPNRTVYSVDPGDTCTGICEAASCCWQPEAKNNCFMMDPLGCLAWEAQCQVLLDHPNI